jgi:hypothetical protein
VMNNVCPANGADPDWLWLIAALHTQPAAPGQLPITKVN